MHARSKKVVYMSEIMLYACIMLSTDVKTVEVCTPTYLRHYLKEAFVFSRGAPSIPGN